MAYKSYRSAGCRVYPPPALRAKNRFIWNNDIFALGGNQVCSPLDLVNAVNLRHSLISAQSMINSFGENGLYPQDVDEVIHQAGVALAAECHRPENARITQEQTSLPKESRDTDADIQRYIPRTSGSVSSGSGYQDPQWLRQGLAREAPVR